MGGRRKSLAPTAVGGLLDAGVVLNDDAKERRARRESRAPTASERQAEVSYDFSSVLSLCTNNKVNVKNTWSIDLLDHIDDVLELQHGSFQKASCTLQASVQIYEKRVDSTHQDTFKMLENVNRTRVGVANDAEESRQSRRKAAGTKGQVSSFLESNLSNITHAKVEREYEVDPLFRKMSKTFDTGGARGLLLNHLHVHQGPNVVFDTSDTKAFPEPQDDDDTVLNGAGVVRGLPELPQSNSAPLCPSLELLLRATSSATQQRGGKDEDAASVGGDSMGTMAYGSPPAEEEPQDAVGAGALGDFHDDEDDGFIMDHHFEDDDEEEGGDGGEEGETEVAAREGAARRSGARESGAFEEDGKLDLFRVDPYSFFKPDQLGGTKQGAGWAGPSHWKFAARRKAQAGGDSEKAAGGASAGRKRKSAFLMDFSEAGTPASLEFPAKPSAIELSKRTLQAASSGKANDLPEDLHYSVHDLCKLFLKPVVISEVVRGGGRRAGVQPVSGSPLRLGGAGDDDAGYFDTFDDDDGGCGPLGGDSDDDGGNLDLVQPSHVLEKVRVDYARTAKKVDVKNLKSALWEELDGKLKPFPARGERDEASQADEADDEAELGGAGGDASKRHQPEEVSFVDSLCAAAPKVDDENVTVPFYFICLLHLANENNLELEGRQDLADFVIR